MPEDTITKILDILEREGPLSPSQVASKLGMNLNTVRPSLSFMRRVGSLVRHFKGIKGVYEISPQGLEYLKEKRRERNG